MSYERFYPNGWQSGESGGTPITPEALNHVEKGIEAAHKLFAGYGIILPTSGWNGGEQTIAIDGVTADASKSDVFASPAPADDNFVEYAKCNVRLYAQLDGAVKFKCDTVPEIDLAVNVMVKV